MIKRIRIRNFLSFKELDEKLGLRTVLVGPNMSGKSNFLDCLLFLTLAVNPAVAAAPPGSVPGGAPPAPEPSGLSSALRRAIGYLGGFAEVVWKGTEQIVQTLEIGITTEVRTAPRAPAKTFEYDIAIEEIERHGAIQVVRERLTMVEARGQPITLLETQGGQVEYRANASDKAQTYPMRQPDRLGLEALSIPGSDLNAFRDLVSSWRFYKLTPSLMKTANPSAPQPFLVDLGVNLSSWLFTLQGHPNEFQRIRQVALDVFPNLAELLIQPAQAGMVSLGSTERYLKRPVSLARMSDGELAFLALLSLILAPDKLGAPLYCIEEPETHLHPHLLETLVEILNQRQRELGPRAAQIIATTHSPLLVDKLDVKDLVVVEKVGGATRFTRPASDKQLRKLLERKESGLGELWYSGALSRN